MTADQDRDGDGMHAGAGPVTGAYDGFVRDALPPPDLRPDFLFDLPALRYPERLNAAAELVDRAVAEGDGNRVAIVNDDARMTYAELSDLSGRIARLLVEREGLMPGNRVLLRGANGAMLFASWLGILKAGGVAVSIMPLLRAGEIATILDKAMVTHALVDASGVAEVATAVVATGRPLRLQTYAGDRGGGDVERLAAPLKPLPPHDTGRDDPALIAFTSGTTGEPKGCIQFHRDILIPADGFAAHILRPSRDDVFASSAPIAFTFGLGALLIFPLRARATAVTIERASPAALLDAIARHKVTALFTAPTAYKEMLDTVDVADIASLRLCMSAGEHLPPTVWHRWAEKTGLHIVDGIGSTEMMHVFISASGDRIRSGATGQVVPGYQACIIDEAGKPCDEGVGRLAVKGPTGCRYLADPRQRAYVHDGWNITGDTYRRDRDGYYWYVARSDDMIVSSGYNIGAPEVENALLAHPAVAECAVVGVPCEKRGQIVKAFVVTLDAKSDALIKVLQDHVKATIAPYKYPRAIEFVDALPKTSTGKLQRQALGKSASTV